MGDAARGDGEMGRHGDRETRGHGDRETRRGETIFVKIRVQFVTIRGQLYS